MIIDLQNVSYRKNGKLIGHNTDYFGFLTMVRSSGLDVSGKKALVLGSGGASNTAVAVMQELGGEVVIISRSKGTMITSLMPNIRSRRPLRSSGEPMRGQGMPVTTSLGGWAKVKTAGVTPRFAASSTVRRKRAA